MKLNVGSGRLKKEGYFNTDCNKAVKPDKVIRIEDDTYPPKSLEEIYASHILEHINIGAVRVVLARFKVWLKDDGILKVSVPNMMVLAELLVDGFPEWQVMEIIYGQFFVSKDQAHKWGYTEAALTSELEMAGFKIVGKFKPGDDSSGFVMGGKLVSINLECVKA